MISQMISDAQLLMSDCVGAGRARGEGAAHRPRHRLQGGGHQRAAAPAGE